MFLDLKPGLPVFLDTETTGLNPRKDTLVLLIVAQEGMEPVVYDVRGKFTWAGQLSDVLAESVLVAHNAKFDVGFLRANGVTVGQVFCTQIAEQVIQGVGLEDARQQGINLSLAGLAQTYGVRDKQVSKAEREWFYTELPKDVTQPIPEAQLRYAAEDVALLRDIYPLQQEALDQRPHLAPTISLEMRVLPALVDVEATGIRVDVVAWRAFIKEKELEAKEHEDQVLEVFGEAIVQQRIEQYAHEMGEYLTAKEKLDYFAGDARFHYETAQPDDPYPVQEGESYGDWKKRVLAEFKEKYPVPARPKLDTSNPNIGSPHQLIAAFKTLGLPVPTQKDKKTREVKETLDSKLLAAYEADYPAIKTLVRFRKAQKFVDSFGESLLTFVEGDRIHPDYNQIGASTGRMSCTRPNWQQIPSRGDGRRLRECVLAAPGYKLLTADFSNIEMRILAEYSRDERLLQMFDDEVDLHSEVARLMFGLPDGVNPKHTDCPAVPGWTYRDVAKTINYGLVYGMSAVRLSRTARIEKDQAERLMAAYFDLFPGVVSWLGQARQAGWSRGYSRTLLGRRRPYKLPKPLRIGASYEERQAYNQAKARIERQSMNMPIQGTSADITKEAVAQVYEGFPKGWGHVVAIVHDELVMEVLEERKDDAAGYLEAFMDQAQYDVCQLKLGEGPRVALPRPEVHISDRWEK